MTDHAPFPLTPLQEAYVVGMSRMVELGGFRPGYYVELDMVNLDPARAERAVDRLLRRHGHLRTVVDGSGTQRVLGERETLPYRLVVEDLTGLGGPEREDRLTATRRRMCDEGVDPAHWPLFDLVVHRVRPRRFRVHLAMSLLLLDGRGIRQVIDEWRTFYHDPTAELPPPGLTYRECRLRLAEQEDTPEYHRQWRYWEERLDTLPDAPRLPLATQPSAIGTVRFTRRTHRLSAAQWQRLCTAFRRHRILPTTALLHVFAEVLGAWADTPRFSLNMLHQNWATSRPEMAGVMGQFGATLPLEVDLARPGDFWERARGLQKQVLRDLQNADVSGVRITRELAARRGWSSRAALPYVFTSMLKAASPAGRREPAAPAGERLACREVTSDLRTPQVLVDNQLHDGTGGGVDCVWDVVDEAFPPGLPDMMFEAYGRMLDALAGPDGAAGEPDPVPAGHRAVVAALNEAAGPAPAERLEYGFLRRAAARPDDPAVVSAARTLTYGETELLSRAVAAWLSARGVGRGDVVPVVMAKGWEQVVAVLGVLRSGAAYCPVDAALPADRVRHLMESCAAPAVLAQSHTGLGDERFGTRPVLSVDLVRPGGEPLPAPAGAPDDLAYVIHTSGSTGLPKGVMIEHRAAVNTVADINQRLALGPEDRVFGISSLSFDLSVWDVFGALAAGAALVLPAASSRPDPTGWARTAATYGATVWNSVPALAQMLAEVVEKRPADAPPVRAFLMSGDWIPLALPDRLRALWPDVRLIAMGGATEASIWSNIHEIGKTDPDWQSVPYGVPLRNQTMKVLDHRMGLRPPWAAGRIHIGGVGLGAGYWRDEQRTAERFVRHPDTGERLYWTGDLGRYRPDGTIEFLGREDRQLKIQGFRVEPGEVEAAAREHPAVRECVVSGVQGSGGQRRLVALVVPGEGERLDDRQVRAHLASLLPHYLVPGRIHVLDRLPLTPNGKVDVAAALAAADRARTAPDPATAGDGTAGGELVARLAALWAELLDLPAVEPDGDFFALGGNSLLALRMIDRIDTELGVELRFGEVFEAPTVRALAGRIEERDRVASCRVLLAGGPGTGAGPDGGAAPGTAADPGTAAAPGTAADPGGELFLFHPVGGSVTSYTPLARVWPGRVHAFQSRALAEGSATALAPDLPAMAAAYREELQRVRPEGPYLLGGWSMGGVLAHEVARQLTAQGHRAAVVMLDSDVSEVRAPATEAERHLEFLADLAGGRLPGAVRTAIEQAPPGSLADTGARLAAEHGWLPPEAAARRYELLVRVHSHNLAVLAAHRVAASTVPTLLLVAGEVDRPDPVPAWRAVCPGLEAEVWPYDHYSIVDPGVLPSVAARITAWLGRTPALRAPRQRTPEGLPHTLARTAHE
ncbi:amino acid adenylation domain-containing protein [Streptomyces sp. NPDC016309]|uniref:non-ribosomal peptide synthetase n=1 Tax=Streptomyces sp. NPDC016309 TaxID=3364965 RepID=UPI00370005E1